MVKIVRIIARLNIGGPAIHTILLSSMLNKDGYKDILICGRPSASEGDMMGLARDKNLEPISIPELGREISFKKDLKALVKLYRIIKSHRPDIVHTHTAKAGTLGRIAAIAAGVPVRVHTFHGHIFDGYFHPFKAKVFLLIEKLLSLFTDKVIVVSRSVEDDVVKRLKVVRKEKCVVIPLGLDLERFLTCESRKGVFRKILNIDDATILVGIIGRLVPIKNHKMFLDAAKRVLDGGFKGKVKFLVIGDGEQKGILEERALKMGLEEHVIFTGWVEDLASVYADLDIVALTSLNEGTPVSIIEALAASRPVVATDVGGVKDIVTDGENGLLAERSSVEDFAGRVTELLLDSGKRERLGLKGREFVRDRHSKNRLAADMKNLYENCLKEKHINRS